MGTYSVDERVGVVTHHLAASMFPNWVGSEQRREVLFEGDLLTASPPIPGVGRRLWRQRQKSQVAG